MLTAAKFVGCFVLGVCVAGCDRSGIGRVVPVQGVVTVDGRPLTRGSVVFKPDATKENQSTFEPASDIGADGTYTLFTGDKQGAPLGWYQVAVVAQELNEKDPYAAPKSLIPSRYNDASTSGLAIEVVETPTPAAYDIKLSK